MSDSGTEAVAPPAGLQITTTSAVADDDAIGRWKEPPVCQDSSLKSQAMTTGELQRWTFPPQPQPQPTAEPTLKEPSLPIATVTTTTPNAETPFHPPVTVLAPTSSVSVVSVSSSSTGGTSNCSTYSSGNSTCGSHADHASFSDTEHPAKRGPPPPSLHRQASEQLNAKVASRTMSRQGRSSQRWVTRPDEQGPIRLVTGCVPIMKDGRVLFISASRKSDWILPKGGWEQDETMAESAVRETFEEAGVLGTLGPQLSPIEYETRKAKKRRLEQGQKKDVTPTAKRTAVSKEKSKSDSDATSKQATKDPVTSRDKKAKPDEASTTPTNAASNDKGLLTAEGISRIRKEADQAKGPATDDNASVCSTVSTATTYSHVQMSLFPLYVTTVAEEWPESGRFRKAVPMDQAIAMLESRPEQQAALIEVKKRGLHHSSVS